MRAAANTESDRRSAAPVWRPSNSEAAAAPAQASDHADERARPGPVHQSEPVVTGLARVVWWLIAIAWVGVTASFWSWWMRHAPDGTPWLYWPATLSLAYQTTALPTLFFYYVGKMRRPIEIAPRAGMRVALVTLCVPSHESLDVIRAQLEALQAVTYEHDSWVLDEGGSPDVRAVASELGVRYFTRKDVATWNQPRPPFQKKTKAGNVNAWLDHVRRAGLDYEVFVQLDIDHRPRPDYLDRVLGYFRDPHVAWVQAPSVCGNLDNWAARGLAEQDMLFQGPLQMGFYGNSRTPFIVGSHSAYRTAAVVEIGGFQPTRAEDHLDTVVLAAHGYEGVYVPELIAVGSGPTDFRTYLRQQFAWAYSMIQIFIGHTPRLLRRYSFRQALQFLMAQTWYALWSLSLATLWVLPNVALLAQKPIVWVPIGGFLVYFLPIPLMSTLMWFWARRWFQPAGLHLSWRGVVLEIARWPVVVWAFLNVLLHIRHSYMITPKGAVRRGGVRLTAVYAPYIALSAIPLIAVWGDLLRTGVGPLRSYYGLVLLNAWFGIGMLVVTLLLELGRRGAGGPRRAVSRRTLTIVATALALISSLAATTVVGWQPFLEAIL